MALRRLAKVCLNQELQPLHSGLRCAQRDLVGDEITMFDVDSIG
ncbi:MAG: hypothetical protein PVI06_14700 [Desulfobacterales bacterium]